MAREAFLATDPQVATNTPVAGQTTITFDSLTYIPGTDELLAFHNGTALIVDEHYQESGPNTVVLFFLPDDIGPDVDTFLFQVIVQGSSDFIPPPTTLTQAEPSRRPDNFGGTYVFDV